MVEGQSGLSAGGRVGGGLADRLRTVGGLTGDASDAAAGQVGDGPETGLCRVGAGLLCQFPAGRRVQEPGGGLNLLGFALMEVRDQLRAAAAAVRDHRS